MSVSEQKSFKFNDEIDPISLLNVLFKNSNLLISIFFTSFLITLIYYLAVTPIYQSSSLLEIRKDSQSIAGSLGLSNQFLNSGGVDSNSLKAEIEIYKSENTRRDVYEKLIRDGKVDETISFKEINRNLNVISDDKTLLTIKYAYSDPELTSIILDYFNEEYIKDRKEFRQQSSAAGRKYISQEIPRIQSLLKQSEEKLNNFKLSTNSAGLIFESDDRSSRLSSLIERIKEIEFKELELREFYKKEHPIYVTLIQQKKLISDQISDIEKDLPNVPNTQRKLENLKREVSLYADVLKNLTSEELKLAMSEASSLSNIRIINSAGISQKISPTFKVFFAPIFILFLAYFALFVIHLVKDRITDLDALIDFVEKENVLGELPDLNSNKKNENIVANLSNEMMSKFAYEVLHLNEGKLSLSIVSSKKNVGKSYISKELFLKFNAMGKKTCLLNLDFRKGGELTKKIIKENGDNFHNFDEYFQNNEKYKIDQSLYVPAFDVEDPAKFFLSDDFKNGFMKLEQECDIIICDTPPWNLFIDAKIISKYFSNIIYVVGNNITTFKDIDLIKKDIEDKKKLKFFFNKFDLFFDLFWFKYVYPYYSGNYYYDYNGYSIFDDKITSFSVWKKLYKWLSSVFKNWFK
ncbi:MAG: exopolysaccharide transport family protein [Gammaproteobacteria bacterium]